MKIVKTLAIAYLLWAILYSLTAGRSWVSDALAFKFNGGPQLVSQLENDGFKVIGTQVEANNKFMALSLSKQEIRNGKLDYDWSKHAGARAERTLNGYKKQRIEEFKQSVRIEKNWAIWAGLNEAFGGKFAHIKKTVDKLTINPQKPTWHPISETRFNFALAEAKITENLWLMPEITNPLVALIRLITVYPVLWLPALIIALSPPQIAAITAYLHILMYGLLILLLTRGLLRK